MVSLLERISDLIFNKPNMNLFVNGTERVVTGVWEEETLLSVLREYFGLIGTRFGCGKGLCGSCTVHVDGEPVRSCITPINNIAGTSVLTIEGLQQGNEKLHPLQQAWIDERVPQCGYCHSGQIMQAWGLLSKTRNPTEEQINTFMDSILCRCGTYDRIKKAILRAAVMLQQSSDTNA